VAARGARAGAGAAGSRVAAQHDRCAVRADRGTASQRPERGRVHRRTQRRYRAALGGQSAGSVAGPRRRPAPPQAGGDRPQYSCVGGGEGCRPGRPDRVCGRRRSREDGSRCQSHPARRKPYGGDVLRRQPARCEAAGAVACAGSQRCHRRRLAGSGESLIRGAEHRDGSARPRPADRPGEGRKRARPRCRLRSHSRNWRGSDVIGGRTGSAEPTRASRRAGGATCDPDDLRTARLRRSRWPDQLCGQLPRGVSPSGCLCRPHSQGCETARIAGPATDHVRTGDQPQNRQGFGPHRARQAARARRRGDRMKRRAFIRLLGGAAAWPLAARAQQPTMPVVGFLNGSTPTEARRRYNLLPFLSGLAESGFVEGRNIAIEYHWAEDRTDRLPEMAAELVRRRVAVIVSMPNMAAALAVKAATQTIPIVFLTGADPVAFGIVPNLARPSGNITGFAIFTDELATKRLELLHELLPNGSTFAFLSNPANVTGELKVTQGAARRLGVQLLVVNASGPDDFGAAFAEISERRAAAVSVSTDPLFTSYRDRIIALAARHGIPTA